ncbi:hypothetical protein [Actinomycetospora atypica]|uniref:MmpS family membrane protein n=1 Tax=Actinomycetospora atypica TaxID=1290095 RepID=A0ABV9YQ60_9PSEU
MTMMQGPTPGEAPSGGPWGPAPVPRRRMPAWAVALLVVGSVLIVAVAALLAVAVGLGVGEQQDGSSATATTPQVTEQAGHQIEVIMDSSESVLRQISSRNPMGSGQEQYVASPARFPVTTTPGAPYLTTVNVLGPTNARRGAWVRCTITVDGQIASQQVGVNGDDASCSVSLTN